MRTDPVVDRLDQKLRPVRRFRCKQHKRPKALVAGVCGEAALLGCQDCIPDCGRASIPKTRPTEVELPLVDPSQQFDPCYGDAALLTSLNPSIGPTRDFTPRWSCSIRLFRYFDDRSFVSA
jgi:hypothetical protein